MREIIFFQRVYKEKIWGGNRLRTLYGMDIPSENTGECWLVSGHPEGQTIISDGVFKGLSLQALWQKNRDIFGYANGDDFPLLIKIIDARDDLSVQVHPNDDYAALKGDGTRGKTECWYVLDCETGGEIVLGHNAKTQEELQSMVTEKKWEQLLRRIPAAKDDFFYVASGTIHALKRGMLVLEIQQPSDTTYRLYDYDRLENGIPRQLHIQESLEVTTIPYSPDTQEVHILKFENITKATLADTSFFSVSRYDVQGRVSLQQDMPFLIMGVIEGQGKIDNVEIKKGDHWLLPYHYGNYVLEGNMTLIVSTKKN